MPTIETKIHIALKSQSKQLPYKVVYAGELYKPSGDPYARFGEVHADPSGVFISDGKLYSRTGFVVITFVATLPKTSEYFAQQAGLIAALYHDGVKMSYGGVCVSVSSAATLLNSYETDGYWNVPVRIPWRCFA